MLNLEKIIFLMFFAIGQAKIGDKKPFCYFPEVFDTTIKPLQKSLDLKKYGGKWYEVARNPVVFEANCVCSEAKYTLDNVDKYVNVENTCLKKNGERNIAHAKAYSKNKYDTFLKVFFVPFVGGNYFILDLDPDYKWVVVGEPCRDDFWILSRKNRLDDSLLEEKIKMVKDLGFDTSKTIYRRDTCNEELVEF